MELLSTLWGHVSECRSPSEVRSTECVDNRDVCILPRFGGTASASHETPCRCLTNTATQPPQRCSSGSTAGSSIPGKLSSKGAKHDNTWASEGDRGTGSMTKRWRSRYMITSSVGSSNSRGMRIVWSPPWRNRRIRWSAVVIGRPNLLHVDASRRVPSMPPRSA